LDLVVLVVYKRPAAWVAAHSRFVAVPDGDFAGSPSEEHELEHPAMFSITEKLYTELGTRGTQPHALGGGFGYE
jgi:hypothetical protein